jgi:Kdo2-lipid IVA lauroyltransferase/acyltransferase
MRTLGTVWRGRAEGMGRENIGGLVACQKQKIGLCGVWEDGENVGCQGSVVRGQESGDRIRIKIRSVKRVLGGLHLSLRHLRHLAEYLAVRIAMALIQAVSLETCQSVSRWLAWLASDLLRIRGGVVAENLRIAFPEKTDAERRAIARRMWEHLILMVCEVAQIHRKIHETNWRKYVDVRRKREWILTAGRQGPKLCVSGHFGNFEALGHVCSFWGFRTYTVARTLDNPYLDALVRRFREAKGQRILPKDHGAGQADEVLATGGILALVGDQHAGRRGCVVDFLGRPASCHKAVALFALLNKAPTMVITCTRTDRPMHFTMGMDDLVDPAENPPECESVEGLTQWYNRALEARIREVPDQYWWLHDRWKDLKPRKREERRAAA